MKKFLTPCLAIIAVAAIVFCFVINGQKGDLQKTIDSVNAQLETLKTESEAKIAEAEAKAAEAQTKADELTKQLEEALAAAAQEVKVMTHEEYIAAENDSEVVIESYVQDHQSWWDNKVTVYLQSEDGAYFAYELACSEEDAAKLVPGQKIRVKGFKGEWGGEVEIMDGAFEFVEGDPYIAEATDVTELLATEDLISHMNEFVSIKGATIVAQDDGAAFNYKNAEEKNDDLYYRIQVGEGVYNFVVEKYLRDENTDVYKAVEGLKVGDVVDIEGFLYWYEGANLHTTGLTVK